MSNCCQKKCESKWGYVALFGALVVGLETVWIYFGWRDHQRLAKTLEDSETCVHQLSLRLDRNVQRIEQTQEIIATLEQRIQDLEGIVSQDRLDGHELSENDLDESLTNFNN